MGGRETDNIIDIVKSRLLEDLTEADQKIEKYRARNSLLLVEDWETRKVRIEKKIKDLEERLETALKENCGVCLSSFKNPVLVGCCNT